MKKIYRKFHFYVILFIPLHIHFVICVLKLVSARRLCHVAPHIVYTLQIDSPPLLKRILIFFFFYVLFNLLPSFINFIIKNMYEIMYLLRIHWARQETRNNI